MAKFLPELDLEKSITVPTHAEDALHEMSVGVFLLSMACTYGNLDCFKTLLNHNAKIDGHVLEKAVNFDDDMTSKN